jgi:hypothetical protein
MEPLISPNFARNVTAKGIMKIFQTVAQLTGTLIQVYAITATNTLILLFVLNVMEKE